jgi:RNA polymerase sigma factor (TIGR02999 family)
MAVVFFQKCIFSSLREQPLVLSSFLKAQKTEENYQRILHARPAGGIYKLQRVPLMRPMPKSPGSQGTTELLQAWSAQDGEALQRLAPIVYDELHRLAAHYMRGERAGHSLQATALVNEAWLRLVECKKMRWQDRAHFLAVSAQLMRRILVDHARRRNLKRGAGFKHVALEDVAEIGSGRDENLVVLDDAMNALARLDPRKAQVVELRYFGGLQNDEVARVLNVSPVTVMRDWNTAKAWLYREMSG